MHELVDMLARARLSTGVPMVSGKRKYTVTPITAKIDCWSASVWAL